MTFCETCRFWCPRDRLTNQEFMPEGYGECRRRAPTGMSATFYLRSAKTAQKVVQLMYPFPPTPPTDWCGEYEAES